MADADHVLTLTPRQAAFVHFLGRYLRKQDGWWDDQDWQDTAWEVAEMFEALPGGLPARAVRPLPEAHVVGRGQVPEPVRIDGPCP